MNGHDQFTQFAHRLGLFDRNEKIKLKSGTPAQVLQHILEQKWKLNEGDKDMIVMCHQFVYTTKEGETKETKSSLVVKGKKKNNILLVFTFPHSLYMYKYMCVYVLCLFYSTPLLAFFLPFPPSFCFVFIIHSVLTLWGMGL